jgi:hypothetical protein
MAFTMKNLKLPLTLQGLALIIGGALSAFSAPAGNLEASITSFPKISPDSYRPDVAAICANTLILAGSDVTTTALDTLSRTNVDPDNYFALNEKVCHLCRLIFVSTNAAKPLRPPSIGAMRLLPSKSMTPAEWPDLPFAIVDNIPLTMTVGYAGAGIAERGESYLAYCKAYGRIRTNTLSVPTALSASNALSRVFSSAAWKSLNWNEKDPVPYTSSEDDDKQILWKQVENMKRPGK